MASICGRSPGLDLSVSEDSSALPAWVQRHETTPILPLWFGASDTRRTRGGVLVELILGLTPGSDWRRNPGLWDAIPLGLGNDRWLKAGIGGLSEAGPTSSARGLQRQGLTSVLSGPCDMRPQPGHPKRHDLSRRSRAEADNIAAIWKNPATTKRPKPRSEKSS